MAHFKSNDLSRFMFIKVASGAYDVCYYTKRRGDWWDARIEDMTLIDATKNAETAHVSDIQALYHAVKRNGTHHSITGAIIEHKVYYA